MSNIVTASPGRLAAQYVRSLAVARGDVMTAQSYAEARGWPVTAGVFKSITAPLSIADVATALSPITTDLAAYLRPLTIIGRLQGLGRAPLRTRIILQTVGGHGAFVAPGASIPVKALGFSATDTLLPSRVGAISVMTRELVENGAAGSDSLIATDAFGAIAQAIDAQFIDPAVSGSANTPMSVTHDAVRFASSGSTVSAIDADLARLVAVLTGADCPLTSAAWCMSPTTATYLSLLRGTGGAQAYPGTTARGGSLLGLPVITSTAITASMSPGERFIVLLEASEILLGDDGSANIEYSDKAALQMDSSPTNSASNATTLTSLWQQGLVGIKVERQMTFVARRSGAVAVLESVNF